jgi:hypothetical protein
MNTRGGLIALIILLGVLLGWVVLRPSPSRPGESSMPGTGAESAPSSEPVPKLGFDLPRAPRTAPSGQASVETPEPEATSAPLEATLEFVEEREALHRHLSSTNDPMFADVTQLMNAASLTKPSQLAAAWTLAQRWGVFVRGEGADLSKVENPKMREDIVEARRHILIDESANDLRRVAGAAVDSRLLAGLEEIGRRHAPARISMPRLPKPGEGEGARRRRPTLPPETDDEP